MHTMSTRIKCEKKGSVCSGLFLCAVYIFCSIMYAIQQNGQQMSVCCASGRPLTHGASRDKGGGLLNITKFYCGNGGRNFFLLPAG
jgi:hypothetical protein